MTTIKQRKQEGYLWATVLFVSGFLLICFKSQLANWFFWLVAILALGQLMIQLWNRLLTNGIRTGTFRSIIISSIIVLFLLFNVTLPTVVLAGFLAFEFFAIGIVILIDIGIKWFNQQFFSIWTVLDGLIHFLLGGIALFNLGESLDPIYNLFGWSLLLRALSSLQETFQIGAIKTQQSGRQRRFGVPVFLSAILPVSSLAAVNKWLSPTKSELVYLDEASPKGDKPDLEVWIHTARKGFEMFGHVDISFEGKTYAYGLYDVDKSQLFGLLGDGVLFRLDSNDYLTSLEDDDWRAVTGYGMVLSTDQKQMVRDRLHQIMAETVPFVLTTESQKTSYLGQLSEHYVVEAFKFKATQFKTYFVMTTNCVLLADTILEVIGTANVASHGILTPGIYLEYFEKEYQSPNSAVVTKFVVGKQEIAEPTTEAN